MNDPKMIVAYRASSDAEAAMLAQSLEAAGIRTHLTGGISSSAFGELPADTFLIEIWIPEDQSDLARKTIEGVQEQNPQPGGKWTCTECNEANDGQFEVCWNCQAAKPRSS